MKYRAVFAGLTTIDIQYFVDDFPEPNKKIKTTSPEINVGGPATNAAVAFSFFNEGSILASAVGRNSFTKFVEKDFLQNHIHHLDLTPDSEKNTVIASVITAKTTGARNIFTHHPDPVAKDHTLLNKFSEINADILMLDGFYGELFNDWAIYAKQCGIPVILDCGSWKDQYEALFPYTEVVICSEDFHPPGGSHNADEIFNFLYKKGIRKSAISRGEKSLIFYENNNIHELPVKQVPVKDTLGAGDFLHGAFCFFYLRSKFNFEEALRKATDFASNTCMYEGSRSWINIL